MKELRKNNQERHYVLCIAASRLRLGFRQSFLDIWLRQQVAEGDATEISMNSHLEAALSAEMNCAKQSYEKALNSGLKLIRIDEKQYPPRLRQIEDPPLILYLLGNEVLTLDSLISIVGTRRASSRSLLLAEDFGKISSEAGLSVVSGLALGVDAASHMGALKSSTKAPTIAVLGNGLGTIYPRSNRELAKKILEEGGALISQFEPDEAPYPHNFLNRNRTIAALSVGTVVIQAALRSGSLVTARYAAEYGRDVFAIPGDVNDPSYEGSNLLIKEGAHFITSPEDILDFYGLKANKSDLLEVPKSQKALLNILSLEGSIHYDKLRDICSIPSTFVTDLLELEMSGHIVRELGNFIVLTPEAKRLISA